MGNTAPNLHKRLKISMVLNAITIIGFVIMLLTMVYKSGQKDQRITQLEKEVTEWKTDKETLKTQINDQNNATTAVNAKLDLLLNHFGITDGN